MRSQTVPSDLPPSADLALPAPAARQPGRSRGARRGALLGLTPALLGLLAVAGLLAPAASAQDIETFEDTYVLQFDETAGESMEDFLDLAKHILGKPLKYSLSELSGVTIQILGPVTVKQDRFENFFQAILKSYGFLVVGYGSDGSGEFLEIVKLQAGGRGNAGGGVDVRSQAPTVQLEVIEAFRNNPATLITTSIPLRYIDARSAVSTFQSFFSQTTEAIRAVENSNSLVITGFGTNVWAAWELVQLVDVPPFKPEPTFEKRILEFRAVDEVEPVLTELLNASQGLRQGQTAGAQQPGAAGLREVEPRIIVDGGANALILIGEADVVARMQTWIDVLDVEVPPSGFTHVIRLQNTDATVMAETLNQVLDDAQAAQQQQQRSQASAAGSSNLEIPASVVADTTSNSLVVTASDRKYAEIVEVLRQLDVRRRQVLVEAAIVETTKSLNDVFTSGIGAGSFDDYGIATSFGAPTGLGSADANGNPVVDIGGTFSSLSPGGSVALFSSDDFPIPLFLQWLESTSETRVLSRPSLLTNDNEEAELASETETAYQVTTTGQNSITTNSFDTVTAGIRLGISPTISAGNYLRLLVRLEVSDFSESSSGLIGAPPDINTREIDTPITVPDGHTVILGGLVSKLSSEGESKVPWLGDLPGLGWLFKSTSGSQNDRFLYVFITAHIIDTDFALLTEISEARKGDVERLGGKISDLVGSLVPEGAQSSELPRLTGVEALFDLPVAAMPATGERPATTRQRALSGLEPTSSSSTGPGGAGEIRSTPNYDALFGREAGSGAPSEGR